MLAPHYIVQLVRAELLRARSMAGALARNLSQVLDNADRALPFALTRLDDLLADDVIRLLGCLQGAHALRDRLSEHQVTDMALASDTASQAATAVSFPIAPMASCDNKESHKAPEPLFSRDF